jgi:hypothetical protein
VISDSRITFLIMLEESVLSDYETLTYLNSERVRHPELADTLELHMALLEARAKFELQNPCTARKGRC